ncbi:glycosyltransferase [Runella sp. CRIBMP]|uniref:glycosyltransferase family 2 protein n=1 Tax=Runella sp. CRIBMP TaxID=2683261 RepID=UPI0014132730|nr:glycosyltransferase family 2 protein [Runella sp. CRIBMP]NBB22938.1 glycosyltransferase [Runella sp. CRIBMP]
MFFSIITCAHNPDLSIFERLVKAVDSLKLTNELDFEWIIVDNNSSVAIENITFIQKFLSDNGRLKVIKEFKPGLTNARITGVNNSKGDWIIFFDDDNEPKADYLLNSFLLCKSFPNVRCWGPGIVSVEFTEGETEGWLLDKKFIFQEKFVAGNLYSNANHWVDVYPAGTGLVIKREMLENYILKINSGDYTLTDRLGDELSSGGDTQIVFNVVKNGFCAGVSESLVINHLINKKKRSFHYLKRLFYLTNSSYLKAHNEVFVDSPFPLVYKNNLQIIKKIIKWVLLNRKNLFDRYCLLIFFREMGDINRPYLYSNKLSKPLTLKVLEYIIKS